jgi:hypothetical protein
MVACIYAEKTEYKQVCRSIITEVSWFSSLYQELYATLVLIMLPPYRKWFWKADETSKMGLVTEFTPLTCVS